MTLNDLRRRRATLEALRLDLPHWNLGDSAGEAPRVPIPVVAIDWSEIYCFIMYEPPREEDSPDVFAAHYAGLNYLLFGLRCRPVLLPPYAAEMKLFVEIQLGGGVLPARRSDIRKLTDEFPELLSKIGQLKKYPAFSRFVEGDWTVTDQLEPDALKFLDEVLRKHIPSVYLNVQERTLDALSALRAVLDKTDGGQKRMASLPDLKLLPESVCERSVAGWHDWNAEMDLQRPRLERQNRADALALAYLQALHQASFWQDVPVYFASRSASMLQVMEDHAGEFQPYRRPDAEIKRNIRSSWRPWDYFAELGYYARSFARAGSPDGGPSLDIEQDLVKRIERIDKHFASLPAHTERPLDPGEVETFSDWETLRGSFDLEGMGHQKHWNLVRQSPKALHLVNLLKSVLSAQDSGAFIELRSTLARNILTQIQHILLKSLPPDAAYWARPLTYEEESRAPLMDLVEEYLDVRDVFERHLLATDQDGERTLDPLAPAVALLGSISKSRDGNDRFRKAKDLLDMLTDGSMVDSPEQASREWLIGAAYFYGLLFDKSQTFLLAWLAAHPTAGSAVALVTRAMCADTCRSTRDYDHGMRLLMELRVDAEPGLTPLENLVWHCVKGSLLLELVEHAGEQFELYPQPGGQSGEVTVLTPMIGAVASFLSASSNIPLDLRVRAAGIVLRLAGRYIPENYDKLTEEARDRRMGWFDTWQTQLAAIEEWVQAHPGSAANYHTLGYYNMKVALIRKEAAHHAVGYLVKARQLAEQAGNRRTERQVIEHLDWAARNAIGALA
jgi:hypothetical protein